MEIWPFRGGFPGFPGFLLGCICSQAGLSVRLSTRTDWDSRTVLSGVVRHCPGGSRTDGLGSSSGEVPASAWPCRASGLMPGVLSVLQKRRGEERSTNLPASVSCCPDNRHDSPVPGRKEGDFSHCLFCVKTSSATGGRENFARMNPRMKSGALTRRRRRSASGCCSELLGRRRR